MITGARCKLNCSIRGMARKNRAPTRILAAALSGNKTSCPLPSSHDRLREAHYFLHRLETTYHNPDPFRYYLHAFVQAFESTTELLRSETQNDGRYKEFRSSLKEFTRRDVVQKLINARNVVAHRESLVPDSSVTVGWFKYGRPKLCIKTDINPLMPSLGILMSFRNSEPFVIPVRVWDGEEVGIVRVWRLKAITDGELLEFCCKRFHELAEKLSDAHHAVGATFPPSNCSLLKHDYQTVLESQYFPEVIKSWNGPPSELVRPSGERLDFFESPTNSATILHSVEAGVEIQGWVGTESVWKEGFGSILLYTIGGTEIAKNTAAFFKLAEAEIEKLSYPKDEQDADVDK